MAIKISGSTIIDDSRNIVNAGVITATSFVGDGSGLTGVSGIATNTSINTSGIVTASSFVGNLTGTASTATAAATAYGLTGSPDVTVGILTASVISAGSTTGTEGQVLQSTGTGVTWTDASSGGISVSDSNVIGFNNSGVRNDGANGRLDVFGSGNFRVFTSPGTFEVNPGISSIRVRVVGGGGNGSPGQNAPYSPAPPNTVSYGGGGGGYAHKIITSFTAPRSYSITVGSAGGTSSFGSEVSATGGTPARQTGEPTPAGAGIGGTGIGGDVNYSGGGGGLSGTPYSGARGGSAGSQKGNGSNNGNIPGLPSRNRKGVYYGAFGSTYESIIGDDPRPIERFPFDVFVGREGVEFAGNNSDNIASSAPIVLTPVILNGTSGGVGGNGRVINIPALPTTVYYGSVTGGIGGVGAGGGGGADGLYVPTQPSGQGFSGGQGGIGAGGGGGGDADNPFPYPPSGNGYGGSGGAGGSGIVIVEW